MSISHILKYQNNHPQVDTSCYIANGAIIAGDVTIGANSSIWFNSVIRGDVAPVIIGDNTNIQDATVIHTSRFEDGSAVIGDNITVGHMALLHACKIHDNAFIGMKSVIMDKVVVEEYGFVAAGSLLTHGKIVKKYELWAGSPAKFVRKISKEEQEFMIDNVRIYINLAKEYKRELADKK